MGRHCARSTCPFCGHPYTDMRQFGSKTHPDHVRFFVRCCSCDATGPMGETADEATDLWDGRTERLDRHGEDEFRSAIRAATKVNRDQAKQARIDAKASGIDKRRKVPLAETERMAELYRAGTTLEAIGKSYGLTREAVRLRLAKLGINNKDGGQHVATAPFKIERAKQRKKNAEQFAQSHYACTSSRMDCIPIDARAAYRVQRRNATQRGIEWHITISVGNCYVLGRIKIDKPFTLDNVAIRTLAESSRSTINQIHQRGKHP